MTDESGHHVKRDEIAFRGEQLGKAKSRAEEVGKNQRAAFEDIVRMVDAWGKENGIKIALSQITFKDEIDQAAWQQFCTQKQRNPLDLPDMEHEDEISLRVIGDGANA
jgi:hypothetical protein